MLELNSVNEAERFVRRQQRLGNDVYWDNYDIVFYRPDERALRSVDGVWRSGGYGFANRSALQDDGTWSVDYRNVRKSSERTRN